MDIQILTRFFMWCTILNTSLLLVASLSGMAFSTDFVYRIHSKWFPMQKDTFNAVFYALIGIWKIIIIVFNVIPWAVLAIIS